MDGLLLDFLAAWGGRGPDVTLPAVVSQPPPAGGRVVDLSEPFSGLDAEQDRQYPGREREQDEHQGAGLRGRAVLRGEFGLAEAGASTQPVPAVAGADHAGIVAAGRRSRGGGRGRGGGRAGGQGRGRGTRGVGRGGGGPKKGGRRARVPPP